MSDLISTITMAVDLAKKALTIGEQLKNVDLKIAIADLTLALAKVKIELAELLEENDRLKREASSAKAGPVLVMRDGLYYAEGDPLPFCPVCFESSRKALHLTDRKDTPPAIAGRYHCQACKAKYW